MIKKLVLVFVAAGMLTLCGCPDYSHLRSTPDYANMTDPDTGSDGDQVEDSDTESVGGSEEDLESRGDDE